MPLASESFAAGEAGAVFALLPHPVKANQRSESDAALLAVRTRAERTSKLATVREAKELSKRLESELRPVFVNGKLQISVSIAARASILENHLRDMLADAPERLKFAPMLDCLKLGIEPPTELEAALERK